MLPGTEDGREGNLSASLNILLLLSVLSPRTRRSSCMCTCFTRIVDRARTAPSGPRHAGTPPQPGHHRAQPLHHHGRHGPHLRTHLPRRASSPYMPTASSPATEEDLGAHPKQPLRDFMFAQIDENGELVRRLHDVELSRHRHVRSRLGAHPARRCGHALPRALRTSSASSRSPSSLDSESTCPSS